MSKIQYRQPHSIKRDPDIRSIMKYNPCLAEQRIESRHNEEKWRARVYSKRIPKVK